MVWLLDFMQSKNQPAGRSLLFCSEFDQHVSNFFRRQKNTCRSVGRSVARFTMGTGRGPEHKPVCRCHSLSIDQQIIVSQPTASAAYRTITCTSVLEHGVKLAPWGHCTWCSTDISISNSSSSSSKEWIRSFTRRASDWLYYVWHNRDTAMQRRHDFSCTVTVLLQSSDFCPTHAITAACPSLNATAVTLSCLLPTPSAVPLPLEKTIRHTADFRRIVWYCAFGWNRRPSIKHNVNQQMLACLVLSVVSDDDAVLAGQWRAMAPEMTPQSKIGCTNSATNVAARAGCRNACDCVSTRSTSWWRFRKNETTAKCESQSQRRECAESLQVVLSRKKV